MRKKLFFPLISIIVLAFIFSFTSSMPLVAEEDAEDVMDMSLEDLLDVEITTAGKKAEKISEIPASVVLITRADIEKYGYRDVQEILENTSGVYVTDTYSMLGGRSVGVRGFWNASIRNVIIMINGVKQYQEAYSQTQFDRIDIPVEAIDRIEVIRGPMSVIYGSGAFFGAINIITDSDKSTGLASVSYGSENSRKLFVRAVGSGEDFKFSLNAAAMFSDGMDVAWNEMSSSPAYATGTTKDYFPMDNYYFSLAGSYKGFYSDIQYYQVSNPHYFILVDQDNPSKRWNDFVSLKVGYQKEFSEKFSLDVKWGFYLSALLTEVQFPVVDEYMEHSLWNNGSSSWDIEANLNYIPSEKLDLTFGVYYWKLLRWYEQSNAPSLGIHDGFLEQNDGHNLTTGAVFAQANFQASKKLKITAGIRLEKIGNTEHSFSNFYGNEELYFLNVIPYESRDMQVAPRLAVIYAINDKNIIKFLYGKAIRMPSMNENHDGWATGVILQPEYINTFELNYIATLSPKLTINISLYRNMLENLIYRKEWMEGIVYHYESTNEGKMNTNGVEVALKAKPMDKLFLDLSISYSDTEDVNNPDRDVMASPKILAYGKLGYDITKDIVLAFNAVYVDKMQAAWNVSIGNADGTFGARIGDEIPAYLNLGSNLRFANLFGKGWFLNLKVSNLLDEEIRYPTHSHSSFADKGTLGYGRLFLASFGIKF